MARRQPLQITMTAREVIAMGAPFREWQRPFADADIALDEISTLRPQHEATVLRVAAVGGNAKERKRVAGDWLCDTDGDAPMRIPEPRWGSSHRDSHQAAAWAAKRTWLAAWEECADARWMLDAADAVAADRSAMILAACACARLSLPLLPEWERRPLEAIEATEAHERGTGSSEAAMLAGHAAAAAASYFHHADRRAAYHAANAAYYAGTFSHRAAPYHAASAFAESGADTQANVLRQCADLVRSHVPTIAVLRPAALRFRKTA